MAQEEAHDAGLALGLSLGGGGGDAAHRGNGSRPAPSQCPLEPSLTLSMPDDATTATASGGGRSVSSLSVGGAVKRERAEDLGEMVSSTAAGAGAEDDDDGSTRKKLRLTKEQSALLEDRFKEHSTLNPVCTYVVRMRTTIRLTARTADSCTYLIRLITNLPRSSLFFFFIFLRAHAKKKKHKI